MDSTAIHLQVVLQSDPRKPMPTGPSRHHSGRMQVDNSSLLRASSSDMTWAAGLVCILSNFCLASAFFGHIRLAWDHSHACKLATPSVWIKPMCGFNRARHMQENACRLVQRPYPVRRGCSKPRVTQTRRHFRHMQRSLMLPARLVSGMGQVWTLAWVREIEMTCLLHLSPRSLRKSTGIQKFGKSARTSSQLL
jgi:hypothetical protein